MCTLRSIALSNSCAAVGVIAWMRVPNSCATVGVIACMRVWNSCFTVRVFACSRVCYLLRASLCATCASWIDRMLCHSRIFQARAAQPRPHNIITRSFSLVPCLVTGHLPPFATLRLVCSVLHSGEPQPNENSGWGLGTLYDYEYVRSMPSSTYSATVAAQLGCFFQRCAPLLV